MGDNEKLFCNNYKPMPLSPEDCMIEVGIVNILGTYRTDTPYDTSDPKIQAAQRCQTNSLTPPCATTKLCLDTQPCIQVKLALAMFWTRSTGQCFNTVLTPPCLQARPFGNDTLNNGAGPYQGYVVTDASTYAPQCLGICRTIAIHSSQRAATPWILFAMPTTLARLTMGSVLSRRHRSHRHRTGRARFPGRCIRMTTIRETTASRRR
jgi:hypothetical protein